MRRTIYAAVAGTLLTMTLTLLGASAASAAPSLTITPNTGLTNGQTVTVSGSGFSGAETVYILECLATATSEAGCALTTATPGTVDATGTLAPTTFTVITGTISGTSTCGTSSNDLDACDLSVGTITGADATNAPITFAQPAATTTTTVPIVAERRAVTVRPSASLHNREVVKVSGVGFTPHDHVFIVECLAGSRTATGCAVAYAKAATINSKGQLAAVPFIVRTGAIGNGRCGTTRSNVRSCAISVGNAAKTDAATLRITFVAPRS